MYILDEWARKNYLPYIPYIQCLLYNTKICHVQNVVKYSGLTVPYCPQSQSRHEFFIRFTIVAVQ